MKSEYAKGYEFASAEKAAAFDKAVVSWLERAQAMLDAYYKKHFPGQGKTLTIDPRGKKYLRVWATEKSGHGRYAYAFIQVDNGDVLKPATWKAPAKHARGSIYTAELGVGPYGANYLR